jgi:hypothetical protein
MEHKHAEILRAIADGKEVEGNFIDFGSDVWTPASNDYNPLTHPSCKWRIKPEKQVLRYRVALLKDENYYTMTVHNKKQEEMWQEDSVFVKWADDWKEVEVDW